MYYYISDSLIREETKKIFNYDSERPMKNQKILSLLRSKLDCER